jgi:hypothetical protein
LAATVAAPAGPRGSDGYVHEGGCHRIVALFGASARPQTVLNQARAAAKLTIPGLIPDAGASDPHDVSAALTAPSAPAA